MKKLKVICTGGTIDKTYASEKGTRNLSFGEPAGELPHPTRSRWSLVEVKRLCCRAFSHTTW